jgi:GNAT superfamily N-acetyltransferase
MIPMDKIDWKNPAGIHIIVCRPALPKDSADVMELTRTIWDGHDYVPRVWKDWLADSEGLLAVAEFGGRVVGLGKLTRLTENEWWLEGLRVHPDYQGRRIASHLMEYLDGYWERTAGGIVRLATPSFRLSVHHLSDRAGFHKIGEFSEFSAPVIPGALSIAEINLSPVLSGQEEEAVRFARQSQSLQLSYGLMDLGYQWGIPITSHLIEAVRRGEAWRWHEDKGLLLSMESRDDEGHIIPRISLLACQLDDLPAFLEDFRRLEALSGHTRAGWVASLHPKVQQALQASGFHRDWEDAVFIYEKTCTK